MLNFKNFLSLLENTQSLLDVIQKTFPELNVSQKGKDIFIKSKNRENNKQTIEKFFASTGIEYKSVFKSSKSNSIEVLSIPKINDIDSGNQEMIESFFKKKYIPKHKVIPLERIDGYKNLETGRITKLYALKRKNE